MTLLPFLPKEHRDLPNHYGVTIQYITGTRETFELASHRVLEATKSLEFVTKDDCWNLVPLTGVQRIEFDKRFSKIIAIHTSEKEKSSPEVEIKT